MKHFLDSEVKSIQFNSVVFPSVEFFSHMETLPLWFHLKVCNLAVEY
jgi:hypothetical protein